jgi:hypothetical protein
MADVLPHGNRSHGRYGIRISMMPIRTDVAWSLVRGVDWSIDWLSDWFRNPKIYVGQLQLATRNAPRVRGA